MELFGAVGTGFASFVCFLIGAMANDAEASRSGGKSMSGHGMMIAGLFFLLLFWGLMPRRLRRWEFPCSRFMCYRRA